MAKCSFCSEEIPPDAERCPLCDRDVSVADEAYELPAGPTDIPAEWQGGAVYSLELPVHCPHCRVLIRTIRVLKLKRVQVTFTSTLPRGGRVVVCPECDRI